jgi:hypothetical protein
MLKAVIIAASLAASTAALAGSSDRLTDVQYMHLARCRALAASTQLGGGDASAFDAALKSQRASRETYVFDRADQLAEDARMAARHAGPDQRAHLIAERDGACQTLLGAGPTRQAGGSGASAGHSVN